MARHWMHNVSAMSATTLRHCSAEHNRHGSGGRHTRQNPSSVCGVLYLHNGVEQGHRLRLQKRQRERSCATLEQRGVVQTRKGELPAAASAGAQGGRSPFSSRCADVGPHRSQRPPLSALARRPHICKQGGRPALHCSQKDCAWLFTGVLQVGVAQMPGAFALKGQ